MSRRRGSVRQRGRGSWLVTFRAGHGVRVSETVRGTKTKAEQRLTEMLREYDTTGLVPDREAPSRRSRFSGSGTSPTASSR